MDAPARTGPPHVPLRHGGWPVRRTPRWLLLAGVLVVAAAVLVGLAVHPSRAQRATDMNDFLRSMTTGIQSCAGGVRESLIVLRAIDTGTSHDRATAIRVASYGAKNCSPANNSQLADLTQYQVHESLARFHLNRAVEGLVTWAFPYAQRVQNDVAGVLRARGAGQAAARAKLQRELRDLDAQRARVLAVIRPAVRATGATGKLPPLPG
ncbi:MAG TPA: hypothetical protein VE343_03565 [Streptosporangiaceae bacterium]|nr:hypothetical protein [Streptosporangiaceae bacterium]